MPLTLAGKARGVVKGTPTSSINPTPVVGVLGVMEDVTKAVSSGLGEEGSALVLLGETRDELDGSAWARIVHDHLGGKPPVVNLEAEMALGRVLLALHAAESTELGKVIEAAHDLSHGGLIQALVDMSVNGGMGASLDLTNLCNRDGVDSFTALLSESQARVLLAVPEGFLGLVQAAADAEGVPMVRLGTTGGELLTISPAESIGWAESETIILDVEELAASSDQKLREIFD